MNEPTGIVLVAVIYFVPGAALGWLAATRRILFRVGAPLIPLLVTVGFAFVSVPYILPGLLLFGMLAGIGGAFFGRYLRTTKQPRA
jgi:hypothetical protein